MGVERWPALLTREQAAEYLGCSPATVSREKAAGNIRSVLFRSDVRYRRADLDDYIDGLPFGDGNCPANDLRVAAETQKKASKRQQKETAKAS